MDQLIGPIEHETKTPRADDELLRRIEDYTEPMFYHGFFDEVDLWLDWIGKDRKVDFEQSKEKMDEAALRASLDFERALGDFLEHHINGSDMKNRSEHASFLKEHIPEPNREQLWLLSCLWKTLKEQLIINSEGKGFTIDIDDKMDWLSKL